jgi:hypothetical protein
MKEPIVAGLNMKKGPECEVFAGRRGAREARQPARRLAIKSRKTKS